MNTKIYYNRLFPVSHTMSLNREVRIKHNPSLQEYYNSLESKIGYKLMLSECRHFGYYDAGTYWPFPINSALRAMEDRLFRSLALAPGAEVLDAGCGGGHVAIRLAQHGLRVQAIDVVDHHLQIAERSKLTLEFFSIHVLVHPQNNIVSTCMVCGHLSIYISIDSNLSMQFFLSRVHERLERELLISISHRCESARTWKRGHDP